MEWKSDLETRLKWDWQDRREKSKQAPKKRNAIRVGNAGKHGWEGPRVICSVKSEEFSKADCRILALSSQSRLSKQFRSSLLQCGTFCRLSNLSMKSFAMRCHGVGRKNFWVLVWTGFAYIVRHWPTWAVQFSRTLVHSITIISS